MVSLDGLVCRQSPWRHSVTVPHTRWRIFVTIATLWQQHVVFYIFNSTVVDWTCCFYFICNLYSCTIFVGVPRSHTVKNPHTHAHAAGLLWTSDQPVAEAVTCTAPKHNRRTSMPSAEFVSAIPEISDRKHTLYTGWQLRESVIRIRGDNNL